VNLQAVSQDLGLDRLDRRFVGVRLHDDDHGWFSKKIGRPFGRPTI
jgi:hypothetical protein